MTSTRTASASPSVDPHRLAVHGLARLGRGEPLDPAARLALVESLARLGLGDLARSVADDPGLDALGDERTALRAALEKIPAGTVDLDATAATFTANLDRLVEDRPELAPHAGDLHDRLARITVLRTLDGALHLAHPRPGGLVDLPYGLPPARETRDLALPALDAPYLLLGLDLGRLVERVVDAAPPRPGRPPSPQYLVEPDLDRLAAWLAVASRRRALPGPWIRVHAGPDALDELERTLLARPGLPPPGAVLACTGSPGIRRRAATIGPAIVRARADRLRPALARIDARDRSRSDHELAGRLEPGPAAGPILIVVSRHTTVLRHQLRDLAAAFERLGHPVRTLSETGPGEHLEPVTVATVVDEIDPALVVCANQLRPRDPGMLGAVPLLTWVQDPVEEVLSREGAATVAANAHDFVAGFYQPQCLELGYPAERHLAIPFLPASPRVFHHDDDPDPALACDACYVGHFRGDAEAHLERFVADHDPVLRPLAQRIAAAVDEAVAAGRHLDLAAARSLTDDACAALAMDLPDRTRAHVASFLAHRRFDVAFRLETVAWAARWADETGRRLRLYGEGWDDDPRWRRFAAGPVAHGEPLRRALRAARVSLQTIPSGLSHQRTFESMLSGALVLGRWTPDALGGRPLGEAGGLRGDESLLLRAGFDELPHLLFEDEAGLRSRLEDALADEDARRTRVARCAEVVRARFTHDAIAPAMVSLVRDRLRGDRTRTPRNAIDDD